MSLTAANLVMVEERECWRFDFLGMVVGGQIMVLRKCSELVGSGSVWCRHGGTRKQLSVVAVAAFGHSSARNLSIQLYIRLVVSLDGMIDEESY